MQYPLPTDNPTSLDTAHLVILGGPDAGIHMLERWPELPWAHRAGSCFPLYIHCRSLTEAQKVWKLQSLVEVIESRDDKPAVAGAFLMNVMARCMFEDDTSARFYAVFWGFSRQCFLYLSWNDAHPYTVHIQSANIQKTKTFLDAIIHLCLGPRRFNSPDRALEYTCPDIPRHIRIRRPPPTGTIIVISDSDEPGPAPVARHVLCFQYNGNSGQIPTWAIAWFVEEAHSQEVTFARICGLNREQLNTLYALPTDPEQVISLGPTADRILDVFGFISPAIEFIYTMYIKAR